MPVHVCPLPFPEIISENSLNASRFTIGGLTLHVTVNLKEPPNIFQSLLSPFQTSQEGLENVALIHHIGLPQLNLDLQNRVYHRPPWSIYHQENQWIYLGFVVNGEREEIFQAAFFTHDHTQGEIYHDSDHLFHTGGMHSLTLFPTDQILLARLLADRQGCILHCAGMILDGHGFAFAGHSGAGKSTTVEMLRPHGEILCDDRNILRRYPDGWRIYGTWSHGDVPDVSPNSAPLRAILLLEQAPFNRLTQITDRREIVRRLPFLIVKPLVDAGWWEKTLDLVGHIAREVPVYRLQFDRSGRVYEELKELIARSS
jgi:hypothetical protein